MEVVEEAWRSVPKPKRGSSKKHVDVVLKSLRDGHAEVVQAQEEHLKGLTQAQANLVKELLQRREDRGGWVAEPKYATVDCGVKV